jgi:UDP-galactopyranose mutase
MVRAAKTRRVYFFEEPVFDAAASAYLDVSISQGVHVVVAHLPDGTSAAAAWRIQRALLRAFIERQNIGAFAAWFYTPLMLPLIDGLATSVVVYDCMDELTGFAGASPELKRREAELLGLADVVFTGGYSLFESKRQRHLNVHAFPSSVDAAHFARARTHQDAPRDQEPIARPRLGFCGVIDERMNLDLVRAVATARPDWQIVMIGPVAKISPDALPRAANIHYLGMKPYDQLPAYLAGWDVALMPFAHNDATRFISPTKTPEYLAAGLPVVSTSIRDVVRPYGEMGLVGIADTAPEFEAAIGAALTAAGRAAVDKAAALLATMSWDRTWSEMSALVRASEQTSATVAAAAPGVPAASLDSPSISSAT